MTRLLGLSSWIYDRLLFLYSKDLRREFGEEMVFAFASDLADAWTEARARGAVRVWLCAFSELIRIGLPSQWENPRIAVPAGAFVLDAAMNGACLMIGHGQASAMRVQVPTLSEVFGGILLVSAVAALVSFVVVLRPGSSPPLRIQPVLLECDRSPER